ncbi:MAG: S8 family serine peptidase, partial [Enterobacterales bacterium]|nr:S8 family serine peptidase [Enterobacterales bacterium]
SVAIVEGQADQLAGFSSRGPNVTVADIMMPTVTAPGVGIYAAYSDQQYGQDVSGPAPSDYDFLQGTSMSSPHVAGAGALLKSVHPTWTADNIRSALMMTANRSVLKEDGTTDATIFDMGAGRIQVDVAAKAGLVMNETAANYQAANPALDGDPKTLNIPSMGNTQCSLECSWTRTLTATRNSDWTITTTSNNPNFEFTVSPTSFSVTEGDTQVIEVTATATNASTGEQAVGWVTLTSNDSDVPNKTLPVFVTVFTSNLPEMIALDANRDAGSVLLQGIEGIEITNFDSQTSGLQKATSTVIQLLQDSDNSSPFDDTTDGVSQLNINLTEDSPLLWADLIDTVAQDMDLFVGRDNNNNGIAEQDELLCASTSFNADEECLIRDVTAGTYWVLVQNWTSSAPGATDDVTLRTAFVPTTDDGNFTVSGPASVASSTPFDVRLNWDDDMTEGDVFLGAVDLFTDTAPETALSLGKAIIMLTRGADDVAISISDENPASGDTISITTEVIPNISTESIDYQIDLTVPEGLTIDTGTIVTSDGSITTSSDVAGGVQLSWTPTRAANDSSNQLLTLSFEANVEETATGQSLTVILESDVSTPNAVAESSDYVVLVQSGLNINGPAEPLSVDEDTTLTGVVLTYTDSDTVANTVTVTAEQGTIANIVDSGSDITFDVTPNADFFGSLDVVATVTDSVNTADSTSVNFSITVNGVNDAPTAAPTATGTSTVTLTANAEDIDGDTLTYNWVQTGGPGVTIINATSAVATVNNANASSGT